MKNLMLGILIGSCLTAGVGVAQELYNRDGNIQAPRGSVQQYDFFRQRGAFLDLQKMRENSDRDRINGMMNMPCER